MSTTFQKRAQSWIRVLGPIVLLAAAFSFLFAPANALDLTSPGQQLEAAPRDAVVQAVGAPAVVDRGGVEDSMPSCATVGGETDPIKCLPIVRWSMAMGLGNTVEFNVTQPLRSVEVNIIEKSSYTGIITFGNVVWLGASLLVNAVTNYKVNGQLVKPLNDFAATFGSSIIDSGAIFLVLTAGLAAVVFSATRGRMGMRRLLALVGSLGAFCILVWGSMNDTGSGSTYEPGTGSPAWLVQEVSGAFSAASDMVATPISDRSADSSTVFSSDAKSDPTSCKSYIDELHREYTSYYTDTGQSAPAALAVMSRWWEETSYRAFSDVQYGDQSNLGPDYAACQQLETQAHVDNHSRHDILAAAYTSGDTDYSAAVPVAGSPMIVGGDTNANRLGRQSQAWGLCQADAEGNYTLRSDLPDEGIEGGKIGGPITPDACKQIFTGDGVKNEANFVFSLPFSDTVSADSTVKELKDVQFAVVGDKKTLDDPDNGLAEHSQAYYYVSNTAGTIRTTPTMNVIVYAIGAIFGGIAMAILAGVLFVMKLLSYVMAFFLIIAALAGIVSQGFGSSVAFLKSWVGYTAITSVTSLLFAFVQMVALALVRTGDGVLGQWSLAMMLWIGLCPALSILLLNWMFKRLFKTSSPFTLRGMQAMAGNPAMVGGAAMAGGAAAKGLMDRGREKLTSSLVNAGANRLSGGKSSADSKSPAANEQILGDAENPVSTGDQSTSTATKDAVTSGAGATAGIEGGQESETTGVVGDRVDAEGTVGAGAVDAAETTGDDPGDVPLDIDADAPMVANALNPLGDDEEEDAARPSFAQRLADFDANGRTAGRLKQAGEGVSATAVTVGTGVRDLGRSSRLALTRAGQVPANLRRQISGGARTLRKRWSDGKATRSALWNDKGLVAEYLAAKGVGASMKVVGTAGTKLAAAASNPQTYKRALKGAALYGGLTIASGGLAVPAAVLGGRALLRHRRALTSGAVGAVSVGAHALTGIAKNAYRAGVPELSTEDRQEAMESMELETRIRRDQSADVATPITELAHGLPVVQERQLTAELRDATATYDAFEAENGRAPEIHERTAMVADLPFYSSMNDDPQLRQLFEQKVAEQTAQAQSIFDAHQSEHGVQMEIPQMQEATGHLPFYAQSIRGLDPRQVALEIPGTGNASAPRRALEVPTERSYDALSAPEAITVPRGGEGRIPAPARRTELPAPPPALHAQPVSVADAPEPSAPSVPVPASTLQQGSLDLTGGASTGDPSTATSGTSRPSTTSG